MDPKPNGCTRVREAEIRNVLIIILALNWLVAVAKIVYGMLTRCVSMSADGFHSLSDGTSNIIGLVGIFLASRPRDLDHPYGHKKYETFFSLAIAALLFLLGFNLLKESITHIIAPHKAPEANLESFAVMLATMAINFWVIKYESRKGKELSSDLLISDSMHTQADFMTSLSVIIALVAIKLGFPIVDPIATGVISFFILHMGFEIAKQCSNVLCDTAVFLDVKKISDIVLGIKGVKACHKIRTRGRQDDVYVDLHVQVDPNMHINQAHRISYEIEEKISKELPQVSDVVVHLEPTERTKVPSG